MKHSHFLKRNCTIFLVLPQVLKTRGNVKVLVYSRKRRCTFYIAFPRAEVQAEPCISAFLMQRKCTNNLAVPPRGTAHISLHPRQRKCKRIRAVPPRGTVTYLVPKNSSVHNTKQPPRKVQCVIVRIKVVHAANKRVSPGKLRPGVIIYYDGIKRCTTDLSSEYQKIVVLEQLWILRHGNSSAVGHGEKPSEMGEKVVALFTGSYLKI